MSAEEEERAWEEEAGMRPRSPFGPGYRPSPEERNWGVAAQLAGFAGALVPFAHILAPLVIWFVKRDDSPFVEYHARESANFQITMTLYLAGATLLTWALIGYVLLPILVLFNVVNIVRAALRASRGEPFDYPLSLRLVSAPS